MGVTKELIEKYKTGHYIYVETGSAMGDGLQKALDGGIPVIIGIECNKEFYRSSNKRFIDNPGVGIILGHSENKLRYALRSFDIAKRAIIFLDAHKVSPAKNETHPLLEELAIIGSCRRKDHTIMIDDVRLMGGELASYKSVINAITRINPKYFIEFEDSSTDKGDVLVAHV